MAGQILTATNEISESQRPRLVRYFTRRTGDPVVAEDLTQETLIEAWRHADPRRQLADHERWLFGVARNVGRRWARAHGQERARHAEMFQFGDGIDLDELPDLANPAEEVTVDLEREELADLLDRALAELPETTRALLLQHYLDELPQGELARRFGMSEGAVAVRIHRGKVTLRRLLERQTRDGATDDEWQETRIWCPHCGMRKLQGRFGPNNSTFSLCCPDCHPDGQVQVVHCEHTLEELAGITSYKPAYTRVMSWAIDFYRAGFTTGTVNCHRCGRPATLHRTLPDSLPLPWRDQPGVHFRCPCHHTPFDSSLAALTLWLPEGRQFWRANPRIHRLPTREIEFQGRPALVTTYQSISRSASYTAISARDTFELLQIQESA